MLDLIFDLLLLSVFEFGTILIDLSLFFVQYKGIFAKEGVMDPMELLSGIGSIGLALGVGYLAFLGRGMFARQNEDKIASKATSDAELKGQVLLLQNRLDNKESADGGYKSTVMAKVEALEKASPRA